MCVANVIFGQERLTEQFISMHFFCDSVILFTKRYSSPSEPWVSPDRVSRILYWIKARYCCERESLSNMRAKLRTVAASNNRDHSIIACSHHIHVVFFFAHIPFVVNRAFQRNASGEVATTSPPFYNEPHRSHVLCVKAEPGTTFTSWSQHHFVAIG